MHLACVRGSHRRRWNLWVQVESPLSAPSPILSGLSEIAQGYDGLVCDVWGVVHNGLAADLAACVALRRFRETRGPVVLLSNAPRPIRDIKTQFARLGVPTDCYDAIVTSGMAAHDDLARRCAAGLALIYHLGPDRDRGVFDDLALATTDIARAGVVLCTGLFDDDVETPEDYRTSLATMKSRRLVMLCANPDLVVQRGGKLVYCAGAIAKLYEEVGGAVVYYGKPHRPIYDVTHEVLGSVSRPLAIGDGLNTDIRGANGAGIDALFIADGIHGEEVEPFTPAHLHSLFAEAGVQAVGSMRTLVW